MTSEKDGEEREKAGEGDIPRLKLRLSKLEDLGVGTKLAKIEHSLSKTATKEDLESTLEKVKQKVSLEVQSKLAGVASQKLLQENISRIYDHLGIVQDKDIPPSTATFTFYRADKQLEGAEEEEGGPSVLEEGAVEDIDAELDMFGLSPLKSPSGSVAASTPIGSLSSVLPLATPPLKQKCMSVAGTPAVKRLDFTLTPRAASEMGDGVNYQASSDEDDAASTIILSRYGAGESSQVKIQTLCFVFFG